MKKKELKKIKKAYPELECQTILSQIEFHLKELQQSTKDFLYDEYKDFDLAATDFHLNELKKRFKIARKVVPMF